MKKNVLIKGILLLIIIALLTIGFVGCTGTYVVFGTVVITITNDNYYYNIYIDGVWWGRTDYWGNLTLYNVPTGYHTFYAVATDNLSDGYVYQTIHAGTNYVAFWVYYVY